MIERDFNPRSREGSDCSLRNVGKYVGDFNPRSREGSDKIGGKNFDMSKNFNPRSREGSDPEAPEYLFKVQISIHAPAKGATGTRVWTTD